VGILSSFLSNRGKAAAPADVGELEDRLARLGDERRRLYGQNAQRRERRRELLLVDESDGEIQTLEEETAAAELAVERLDEAEPLIMAELTAARGRRRAAQWAAIRTRFFPAGADYLAKMRAARLAYDQLVAIRAEAINGGFGAEAASAFPAAPLLIDPDTLAHFERALLHSESVQPAPAAVAAPAAPQALRVN
jgi:hypothetical protein